MLKWVQRGARGSGCLSHSPGEIGTPTCWRSACLSTRLRSSRWLLMTAISIFSASFPNRVHLVLRYSPSAADVPVRISLSEPINDIDHVTRPLCLSISMPSILFVHRARPAGRAPQCVRVTRLLPHCGTASGPARRTRCNNK